MLFSLLSHRDGPVAEGEPFRWRGEGSFSVLFMIWITQFQFFRHYGLEDKPTVRLTGMLLMGVLFAIYPLKFLFGFLLLTCRARCSSVTRTRCRSCR